MMDALGGGAPPMGLDENGFAVPTGKPVSSSGGVVVGPLYAAFAVTSALARATRTGEGCYLDVSCADAVVAVKWLDALPALNPEKIDPSWGRGGTVGGGSGGSAKYQYYETKDGKYILFCAIEAKFWKNWCVAAAREDLLGDHRDEVAVDFAVGRDDLRRELQETFHTKTLAEWMRVAADHDITMGPALRFDEIQDDPHLRARQQVVVEHHPLFGDFLTLGNPIVVPGQDFTVRSAPGHGQHTDEILAELGYDDRDRQALRDAGVIR